MIYSPGLTYSTAYVKKESRKEGWKWGQLQGQKSPFHVHVHISAFALLNQMETQHGVQRVITLNAVILHLMEFHCFQW